MNKRAANIITNIFCCVGIFSSIFYLYYMVGGAIKLNKLDVFMAITVSSLVTWVLAKIRND